MVHQDIPSSGARTFDLAALVREQVEAQRLVSPVHPYHLTLPAGGWVLVHADANQIRHVVATYLSNALTASPPDHLVAVSVEVQEGQAWVAVRDQGPGLSAEELRGIWEPHDRKTGSASRRKSDLLLCKRIVQQHGGHVGVKSGPAFGSVFWFALPVAP